MNRAGTSRSVCYRQGKTRLCLSDGIKSRDENIVCSRRMGVGYAHHAGCRVGDESSFEIAISGNIDGRRQGRSVAGRNGCVCA